MAFSCNEIEVVDVPFEARSGKASDRGGGWLNLFQQASLARFSSCWRLWILIFDLVEEYYGNLEASSFNSCLSVVC